MMARLARAASLAAWLVVMWCVGMAAPPPMPVTQPAPVCHEDQSCWDWRSMGNRCGRDSVAESVRCYR